MSKNKPSLGHLLALFTIFIWGISFISTKILLREFTTIEIFFTRFLIGYIALWLMRPKYLRLEKLCHELLFLGAGASGITLYFLFENRALTLTTASNVSIIVAIAPFFTALLSGWFLKSERPRVQFYIGFVAAIAGIALISYNGATEFSLNPLGDLLSVFSALVWAIYSILLRKISQLGHSSIQTTRRIFMYGILLMLPALLFMDYRVEFTRFASPANAGNFLLLGLGASALCYLTWGISVKLLGAVRTSVYIYLIPVVTVTFSVIFLNEPLTPVLVFGTLLTIAGLWLSETKIFTRR